MSAIAVRGAARPRDEPHRGGVAGPDQRDDVARGVDVVAERPEVADERPAAGLGLDAADLAAQAALLDAGHRDVADVARRAVGAAVQGRAR